MPSYFTEQQIKFATRWWINQLPKKPGVSGQSDPEDLLSNRLSGVGMFGLNESGKTLLAQAMRITLEKSALSGEQISILEKAFHEKLAAEASRITQRLEKIEKEEGEDKRNEVMRMQSGIILLQTDYGPIFLLGEIFKQASIKQLEAPGILPEKTIMYLSPFGFIQIDDERNETQKVYSAEDIASELLQSQTSYKLRQASCKLRNGFEFNETDASLITNAHKTLVSLFNSEHKGLIEKLYLHSCNETVMFTEKEEALLIGHEVMDAKKGISELVKNTVISSVLESGVLPEGYGIASPTESFDFDFKPRASLIEKFKQNQNDAPASSFDIKY